MAESIECELCGRRIERADSYIVRIDCFADPSLPQTSAGELATFDFDQAIAAILNQANGMTAEELQDGVHRRFEYRLCPPCHRKVLANPLGKPRSSRAGEN